MSERIAAFVFWAAAAASLVYWGLRMGSTSSGLPASVQPVAADALRGDIGRLFAVAPAVTSDTPAVTEPALAARFKLIGVMAPPAADGSAPRQGIALIAIDDKPPRPYRVGAPLEGSLVLQSVAARSVTLGPTDGSPAVRLELPLPTAPATGSLPPAAGLLSEGTLPPPGTPDAGMPPGPVVGPTGEAPPEARPQMLRRPMTR